MTEEYPAIEAMKAEGFEYDPARDVWTWLSEDGRCGTAFRIARCVVEKIRAEAVPGLVEQLRKKKASALGHRGAE